MAITLGIDCGTQSTKTIAFDSATRKVLAHASHAYDVLPGLPAGAMEQHPSTWVDAMDATVREVVLQLGARATEVRAIGVSGQQHGFVPLDAQGQVIRPAKLWCDTSTVGECAEITRHFGGTEKVIGLVGNAMLPGYTAPKILWLKRNEPENFQRLRHVLLPHDYLNFILTGVMSMEYGDASGTALLDVRTRAWSKPVVEFIDPHLVDFLPELKSSRQPVGELKPELASGWSLPKGVLISAGGGDNMMGAIGTANVTPGCITASLGTSGTIYACTDRPVIDPEGEIAAFCDSTDAWLPLLCTMNVTVATEQVRKLFGWQHPEYENAAAAISSGSDGLLFLPYLQGERTPNLPNGTGVLHGLTTRNWTPGHLARATMEGVTLGMAYGLERLSTLGVKPREIRLTGGGSRSALWRQLCADIFGAPVITMVCPEGAALGAAIQALAVVETDKTVVDWASDLAETCTEERAEPQPQQVAIYRELLARQTRLTCDLAAAGHF
jgi:xylulokinase